jgi:transposase
MGVTEAVRLAAVREAVAGRITIAEGMRRTGLGRRQFVRYKRRYARQGPAGMLHGNRGRPSPRRLAEATRERVVTMLEHEVVLNDCHIRDLLQEDGLGVSADTIRRIRLGMGKPAKQRRRPRQHRRRREREAHMGAMALVDGSQFHWVGQDDAQLTLMGAIDDATGRILALTFRATEDLHGYTVVLQRILRDHGVPWTLYGDRTGIIVRNDRHWTHEEELEGRQRPSHFGLMLEDLGIRYIAALSPQAKGRIERLWRTLQDRLAAELALAGIRTLAAAEAFLPGFITRFNASFGRTPREPRTAWRRVPRDLDRILACRYPRVVKLDNTVTLAGEILQLPPGSHGRSYAHCRVEVRDLLDGRRIVLYQQRVLLVRPAPKGGFELVPHRSARASSRATAAVVKPAPPPRPPRRVRGTPAYLASIKPAANHPFRRAYKPTTNNRKEKPEGVSCSLRR